MHAATVHGTQVPKGIASARSDDTKSIKAPVVDWITSPKGVLTLPTPRHVKADRGFHHARTGELLCPVNLNWSDSKQVHASIPLNPLIQGAIT